LDKLHIINQRIQFSYIKSGVNSFMDDRKNYSNYNNSLRYDCDNRSYLSKFPKQKTVILECGFRPQDAFFEIDDGKVEEKQEFVLDRLKIDTSFLKKPLVKIEFSSLVVFEAEDEEGPEHEVEVDLLFKLIRICDGEKDCVQSWRYLYEIDVENSIDELEVEMSQPFAVTFCDRPCSGCCEYIITVEGIDFEGDFDELRVIKPNLSAIATGNCE
jgi:hypothetical protein